MPVAAALPYVVAGAQAYSAIKQGNAAGSGGSAPQVNIDALNNQAQSVAKSNALASAELEKQLTPEVPALRTESINQLLNSIRSPQMPTSTAVAPSDLSGLMAQIQSRLSGGVGNPLLDQAANAAGQQLSLGGTLPLDVRNLVARTAGAHAGAFAGPGGGLGMGRDITARDLGLTSLDLLNSRINNAATIGGAQGSLNNSNFLNLAQLLSAVNGQGFSQRAQSNALNFDQLMQSQTQRYQQQLAAASLGQSIQQPMVGLDPSSIANLAVGNQNVSQAASANNAALRGQAMNNLGNLAGQFIGSYLGKSTTPSTTASASPPQFNYQMPSFNYSLSG